MIRTERLRLIPLIALLLCFACSQEDEVLPQPGTPQPKPKYEIMIVFAPGQLGDKGYADDLMEAINLLTFESEYVKNDSIDVNFISPWSLASIEHSLTVWASDAENPFEEGTYARRLLVLTESFMLPVLDHLKHLLRPTDEVLVLKVNDDDVRAAAETYGLGSRLHGLNISVANSMRRYCRFMGQYAQLMKQLTDEDVNLSRLVFHRLYDPHEVTYRDSIYETLTEELPDSTRLIITAVSNLQSEGLYAPESASTVIEAAYVLASLAQATFELTRVTFNIIDLGSGNSGWDYFRMGKSKENTSFHTLVIDGNDLPLASRCYVKRLFGMALISWTATWLANSVGSMPRTTLHCNDTFCTDNIPDMSEWLDMLDAPMAETEP